MSTPGNRPLARAGTALLAAGLGGLAWSLAEARAFTLRRFTAPVLPAGAADLRVLHVSDLHLVPRDAGKQRWLDALDDLEPDLVVSTGDTLAHRDAVPAAVHAHRRLLRRPGAFVLGSNDYYAPRPKNPAHYLRRSTGGQQVPGTRLPTTDLVRAFAEAGWLDLSNRRGTLQLGGLRVGLRGVDDPHLRQDDYPAVAGPPPAEDALSVGVTHAPYRRVLDAMTADGMDLVLAGHTHGGQLCLPVLGALVTNCDLPRAQAKGLSHWRSPSGRQTALHVSAGLGTSPYTPVRFACRPEATLLTLTAR